MFLIIIKLPCERENLTGVVFKQIKQPPPRKSTGRVRVENGEQRAGVASLMGMI
jgi:hypothetical protein